MSYQIRCTRNFYVNDMRMHFYWSEFLYFHIVHEINYVAQLNGSLLLILCMEFGVTNAPAFGGRVFI